MEIILSGWSPAVSRNILAFVCRTSVPPFADASVAPFAAISEPARPPEGFICVFSNRISILEQKIVTKLILHAT